MYSEDELNAAVDAGVLERKSVQAFRNFVEHRRKGALVDEEHFRLLTGFSDIFVSFGILLVFIPTVWLGDMLAGEFVSAAAGAALSWALAEYFTRVRRQALPSILLVLTWVGSIIVIAIIISNDSGLSDGLDSAFDPTGEGSRTFSGLLAILIPSAMGLLAAGLHWWRFRVPITVAMGVLSAVWGGIALIAYQLPSDFLGEYFEWLVLSGGVFVFLAAMYWDGKDLTRSTRKSDVAFWLHLGAAPMLVHPVFANLLLDGGSQIGTMVGVLGVYLFVVLIAIVIDRRASLVSAAAYVLYAVTDALSSANPEAGFFLACLFLGTALLLFSVLWGWTRRMIVLRLPQDIQRLVPAAG